MKKRVLLISYNFSPEPTGIGKYNGEMVDWLVGNGYDCAVITTYPYYPFWKVQPPYHKQRFSYMTERTTISGSELIVHRCPQYIPSAPSGLRRILQEISFFISALLRLLPMLFGKKYDLVVTVSPSFLLGFLGILAKKIWKTKFLYHIQDLQIEAARDLKMIKSDRVIKYLFKLEKFILSKADFVSSISESMVARIAAKANDNVLLFPNWADTNLFYPIEDKLKGKQEFGFSNSDRIILYSGGIGEKQGLEAILYAANELKYHTDLKFLICGSGPYKSKLEEMVKEMKLVNVIFFPLQPFEKFNAFLNMADVHLVIQKANASDLVMPSKLTTILAVGGLALVTANEGSGLHSMIKKHNMAIVVDAEDQQVLNRSILESVTNNNDEFRRNARVYAEKYLSIETVMHDFENSVLNKHVKKPGYSILG
ncbi:WcaI family glycosyltransferase [Pedobacter sp. P351]|uniref:WcaI family glycosyltransferase n=1 Tax=Pedobacter superstes TaxID=3133441 RepID=UPI0030A8E1A4